MSVIKKDGTSLADLEEKEKNGTLTSSEKIALQTFKNLNSKFIQSVVNTQKNLVNIASGIKIPPLESNGPLIDTTWIRIESEKRAEENYLRRLQIKKLEAEMQVKEAGKPFFDSEISCIYLAGKLIKITKNTDQFYLCKTILKNEKSMAKEWDRDVLAEKLGGNAESVNWHKIYNAAREVNKKIAVKTSIEDFFIATSTTVTINPQYIK